MSGRKHKRGFREQAETDLIQAGFTWREAEAVMSAVVEAMTSALKKHEEVVLPFGALRVMRNPAPKRAWRFGRVTTFYQNKYRVVLETNEGEQ